jgi:hypothetical protein
MAECCRNIITIGLGVQELHEKDMLVATFVSQWMSLVQLQIVFFDDLDNHRAIKIRAL